MRSPSAFERIARHGTCAALAALFVVSHPVGGLAQDGDPAPPPNVDGSERAERKATKQERKESKKRRKEEKKRAKQRAKRDQLEAKTAVAWYQEALDLYERGKYLGAREILLPLEDSIRAADLQEEIKLLIADTYFYQGGTLNLAEALARYRSFLTFYPSSDRAEYVQFQIGNSYFRQLGDAERDQSFTDSAIAEYERFLELYPSSEWADEARSNMNEARALKARSAYDVAEFYWAWENWDAAADRFASVLANHPTLPEREEAIFYAAQSYYQSGDVETGHAYAARLREDYPNSSYLRKLDPSVAATGSGSSKREAKLEKEAERTRRRQIQRDAKRSRQIRKDSGLPGPVPVDAEVVGVREMESGLEPVDAGPRPTSLEPGDGTSGMSSSATMDGGPERDAPAARDEDAARAEREKMQRLEEREQAEEARRAEADERRAAKRAEKQRKKEEKARRKAEKQREKAERKAQREAESQEDEDAEEPDEPGGQGEPDADD